MKINNSETFIYGLSKGIDTTRPTVVFIHGAANDHSVWNSQCRYFGAHGWNAFAVDLPGHGKSEGKPLDSIDALANWIESCLTALGVDNVALVGHSMGSLIALAVASRNQEKIKKLVMIGTAIPMPVSETLLSLSRDNPEAAYKLINQYSLSDRAKLGSNDIPGMSICDVSIKLMNRSKPGVLYADFTACNQYKDGIEAARKVACPVLLILGSEDKMTPAKRASGLVDEFKTVKTEKMPQSGHSLMLEQPNRILDCLSAFL